MKRPDRMIYNDRFFLTIWRGSVSIVEIAQIYGTSRAAIYRAARRFGHGPRVPLKPVCDAPDPRPKDYQEQLLWSRGRWSRLREIADLWGRTLTQVQADFHRVRIHAETGSD